MMEHRILRLAGAGVLALLIAAATCTTSCSSKQPQNPQLNLTGMHLSPAPAGSCEIDGVKMCQDTGGAAAPATMPGAGSYGLPSLPESVEFQIPLGQTIKLMCYYDPQRSSVYRADATAESALTTNSVEYLKQRGYCINK